MRFFDLTFATPEENLACDEALLDACEADGGEEVLRVWESHSPFAVMGCGSRVRDEVHVEWCRRNGIPLLRRASGGCAVLQGPGCLNFALVLRNPSTGPLTSIPGTNDLIAQRHADALRPLLGARIHRAGLSDLALDELKISGNAQRRRRRFILFHGTFLLDFDLPLIERTLAIPPRQPAYRRNRSHASFVTNTGLEAKAIKAVLRDTWCAKDLLADFPLAQIDHIVRRHVSGSWVFRF